MKTQNSSGMKSCGKIRPALGVVVRHSVYFPRDKNSDHISAHKHGQKNRTEKQTNRKA